MNVLQAHFNHFLLKCDIHKIILNFANALRKAVPVPAITKHVILSCSNNTNIHQRSQFLNCRILLCLR